MTLPQGADAVDVLLARLTIPAGGAATLPADAAKEVSLGDQAISATVSGESGPNGPLPAETGAGFPQGSAVTLSNGGNATATVRLLLIGLDVAVADLRSGASVDVLVDARVDGLRPGIADYGFEELAAPDLLVDTARDGAALMVVDRGSYEVVRDGGAWSFGLVGGSGAPATPGAVPALDARGQALLAAGSYAVVSHGAAFHNVWDGPKPESLFLLTIEVNSAVVEQQETAAAGVAALTPTP